METQGPWQCSWMVPVTIVSLFLPFISISHIIHFNLSHPSQDCFPIQNDLQRSQTPHLCDSVINKTAEASSRKEKGEEKSMGKSEGDVVYYRNAPWRPEIGKWLSSCDPISPQIDIVERTFGGSCAINCSGNGVCNQETRQCRCPLGVTGEGCSERVYLECNYPATPSEPYGKYVASICATHCDKSRAFCFCGEGTKYPQRPVSDYCGFAIVETKMEESKLGGWPEFNFSLPDFDNILASNESKSGWCNVDPIPEEEAIHSKPNYKEICGCVYDGFTGRFCEIPNTSSCINQCSGHGYCQGGFCKCEKEWYGMDCSIPSSKVATKDWPEWLQTSSTDASPNGPPVSKTSGSTTTSAVVVKKKRPLIYIYDLPPELNIQILEGRRDKGTCVNRLYDHENRTIWTDHLYGAQWALYEGLLTSRHRTLNGEEADYFLPPMFDSCIQLRANDAPYFSKKEVTGMRSIFALEFYKKAYDHIVMNYPFWNRSAGRDHLWIFVWDEGPCYAPKEIQNGILLSHWGNTNSKHNYSTSTIWVDNWNRIPPEVRGDHACFDPQKDIVLPSWKSPDPTTLQGAKWRRPRKERKIFYYFNGDVGMGYYDGGSGREKIKYSMGIRQKVAEEFGSVRNKEGRFGRQHKKDVIVTYIRAENYHDDLSRSLFCGVFPGEGWSGRLEDSVLHGCIPVIVQDGIQLPFENVLNYESFSVRIKEKDIPNMINILRMINETRIEAMMKDVRSIWPRFLYRDTILSEAERQKQLFGDVTDDLDDWIIEFSKITDDDVFSTLFQVLHYKLHNDAWRKLLPGRGKEFGVTDGCMGGSIIATPT